MAHAQDEVAPAADAISNSFLEPEAAARITERAVSLVEALPWSAHVVMLVGLLAGLALWLYGARLIKPTSAVLGVAAGGIIGLLMPPFLGIDQVGGISGWLIGLGAGMIVGFVVALVMLKVAITFAGGLAFATAGLLGSLIFLQYAPQPTQPDDAPSAFTRALDSPSYPRNPEGDRLFLDPRTGALVPLGTLVSPLTEDNRTTAEARQDQLELMAARIRAVIAEAVDTLREAWGSISSEHRLVIVGATLGSFSIGLLCGLWMPNRSAALITSLLGSAIWLACGAWLIEGVSFLSGARGITKFSPEGWAIVWGIVAVLGLALQIGGLAKGGKAKGGGGGGGGNND